LKKRASAVALFCLWSSVARADERAALVPIAVGAGATSTLQRAFHREIISALLGAGFRLKSPNEVDLFVGDRPEFLACRDGACLYEEATFLGVRRLILPRFDRNPDDSYTIGVALYDANERRFIATSTLRCSECTVDRVKELIGMAAVRIRSESEEFDVAKTPATNAPASIATPTVTAPVPPRSPLLRPFKWATLGIGLATTVAGITLMSLNNLCLSDTPPKTAANPNPVCPIVLDGFGTGAPLFAVGGALLITSGVLFYFDRPPNKKALE